MKVESVSFYDGFNNYLDVSCGMILNREFLSINDVACCLRQCIVAHPTAQIAIAFLNNWRYLYVTEKTFDVHYHNVFNYSLNQPKNGKEKN